MNPEYARAFLSAVAGDSNSRPKPLGGRGRLGEPAKKRFPRDTYQHRRTDGNEPVQRSEQGRVVFWRFPNTDPWINRDSFRSHPVAYRHRNALSKEFSHLCADILVVGLFLHRSWLSLHMHQNDSGARFCSDLWHAWVPAQRGDIIDDFGAQLDGCLGDNGFRGVDGNNHPAPGPETLDHGDDPAKLLFGPHWLGARARRLSSDIDDLGTF